jgi:mRNA interferase RelE/StbE
MKWQIQVEKNARKSLGKIPNPYRSSITDAIEFLKTDQRPRNTKKLKGYKRLYRIRISDYRVVYQIWEDKKIILVTRIAHRSDVYRGL